MSERKDIVEMKVEGLVFDPVTNTPIIILKDSGGAKSLPIWVGYPEATAIALEMESVATPRPMTHDLIKNLLGSLKAKVNHITVCDLKNNTFYAIINITINGNTLEVDSRPSDAIAVALRVKAPIYVSNSVLENAKTMENAATAPEPEDEEAFKKWLHNAKPSDFGSIDQ